MAVVLELDNGLMGHGQVAEQCVLAEPSWMERMEAEDFRALTPVLYRHVIPYGTFRLDMDSRLPIDPIHYQ